jgi:hypothetical protein
VISVSGEQDVSVGSHFMKNAKNANTPVFGTIFDHPDTRTSLSRMFVISRAVCKVLGTGKAASRSVVDYQ